MGIVQDKVAVITGGGRGIGRETCLLMAEEGAKVEERGVSAFRTQQDRHPRQIASVVVYLASDHGSDITGQCVAVVGERIDIISHPTPTRTRYMPGGWTVETLQERFKTTLGEGDNLYRV